MLDDQDNIFDVPHSLPGSAHMAAVSTRTPTGTRKNQPSRFMPDYGGLLEVPGTNTKRTGLRNGVPFDTKPLFVTLENSDHEDSTQLYKPSHPQCLIATSYLQTDGDNDLYRAKKSFSLIRSIDSTLYLDLVKSINCDQWERESVHQYTTYAHIPYPNKITGIKYCDSSGNFVIVKFDRGVKLVHLNNQYKIPRNAKSPNDQDDYNSDDTEDCDTIPLPDQSAISSVNSFAENQSAHLVDASLSRSQSWLQVASEENDLHHVKLYDLNQSKQAFRFLTLPRLDEFKVKAELSKKGRAANRNSTLRSFIPAKSSLEELRQIECDPEHLVNSVLVTSSRIVLIDPRSKDAVLEFADKFKIRSVSAIEYFRQIEFSKTNDRQLYLLSNHKVRALDRRFLSKDLNTVEHMLDSETYDMMSMKLVHHRDSDVETLCLSSNGRICFVSFDQAYHSHSLWDAPGELVNPRSMHGPIHEPSPAEVTSDLMDELYGLDVLSARTFSRKDVLFSTLQLSQTGDVVVRGFLRPRDDLLDFESSQSIRIKEPLKRSQKSQVSLANPDLEDRDILESRSPSSSTADDDQLNILNPDLVLRSEESITKRARMKYEMMKKKMGRSID